MDEGCDTARQVFDKYIEYLAIGFNNLISIFDPECILIAGGISNQNEKLLDPLKKLIPFDNIRIAKLKNDGGIIGAAAQQYIFQFLFSIG